MLIQGEDVPNFLKVVELAKEQKQRFVVLRQEDGYVTVSRGILFTNRPDLQFENSGPVLPIPPFEQALRDHLKLPDGTSRTLHLDEKVILRNEQTRLEINEDILKEQLLKIGLSEKQLPNIRALLQNDSWAFEMKRIIPIEGDELRLIMMVQQDANRNFQLAHYELRLLQPLDIPHVIGNGIDSTKLEGQMKSVQWDQEFANPLYIHLRIPDGHADATNYFSEKIISDVFGLMESGPAGKEAAEKLQMKYWRGLEYEYLIPNLEELVKRYETNDLVVLGKGEDRTIQEIYPYLKNEESFRMQFGTYADLEKRMQAIDWKPNDVHDILYGESSMSVNSQREWEKIYALTSELDKLSVSGADGQQKVVDLLDKYWKRENFVGIVDPFHVQVTPIADETTVAAVRQLLSEHRILENSYEPSRNNDLQALAQGYFQRLYQQQTIVPEEHISHYHVLQHYHPGHQVYEIGHELRTVGVTTDYAKAIDLFLSAATAEKDPKNNFLLVGEYHHMKLQLDLDGYPQKNTGIVLTTADLKKSADQPVLVKVRDVHPVDLPVTISVEAIVRFHPEDRTLRFYDEHLQPLKYNTMNEKNEEYLQKQLQWVGFGEHLNAPLKAKLQEDPKDFMLTHQTMINQTEVAAVLHFSKSQQSDLTFFNRYQIALQPEKGGDMIKQMFYIHPKEDNIALKEAYNQLNGRAVFREMTSKEGEKYMAWDQLNFKETDKHGNYKSQQFNQNYGYDLAATLAKYPIKELETPEYKERLMESLQRGNRQSVTLQVEGKEQKIHVEAAPQFKSLNFYDEHGKRQDINKVLDGMKPEQPSQQQGKKEGQQQGKQDDEGEPEKKNKRGKGMSH
jgi:hypothetical protein